MSDLFSLPLLAYAQPIYIVWAALLIEKLVPISSSVDPLLFFKFLCQRMATKVLHPRYSSRQLTTSGSLALLVLVLPLLIIFYFVYQFASYQWLLDLLLLWILLQFTHRKKTVYKGISALQDGKNKLAKDLIQQEVLRNTQSLSSLGLAKASLESIFLRYHHQQFTTIICYLLLGPIAALCYRLCYEANQVWNIKLSKFHYFGQLTNKVTQLFQIVPSVIMSFSFVFLSSPRDLISHCKQKQLLPELKQALCLKGNLGLLLQTLSSAVNINTGGPVMYNNEKVQRTRYTFDIKVIDDANETARSKEPTNDSVKTLISLVNRHLIVSLLVITWILFWYFLD